jgi:hypothetical protein
MEAEAVSPPADFGNGEILLPIGTPGSDASAITTGLFIREDPTTESAQARTAA